MNVKSKSHRNSPTNPHFRHPALTNGKEALSASHIQQREEETLVGTRDADHGGSQGQVWHDTKPANRSRQTERERQKS